MDLKYILFIIVAIGDTFKRNGQNVEASDCTDKRRDCKRLASFGWCGTRPNVMKKYCGITCKLCDKTNSRPSTVCRDARNDCYKYQSYCNVPSRRSTMYKFCRRTCRLCHMTNILTTTATTTKRTTTTKKTITENPKGCVDLRDDCALLAEKRYCENPTQKDAMEKLCPYSCGVCPKGSVVTRSTVIVDGVCKDTMKGCNFMLKRGWCEVKKPLMKSKCQKTCNLCDACSDKRDDCLRYKNFGWCERKQKEMIDSCPRTCSLCHLVKVKPTAATSCLDLRGATECEKMRKLKFCDTRKEAMQSVCKKTCGWCRGPTVVTPSKTVVTVTPTKRSCSRKDKYGVARCEYYSHIGWCEKHLKIKQNCYDTCVCNYVKETEVTEQVNCKGSKYGCCWDNKTAKQNKYGLGCPQSCDDDSRFVVLCGRFGGDCEGTGGLAKSLQKFCRKTCNIC